MTGECLLEIQFYLGFWGGGELCCDISSLLDDSGVQKYPDLHRLLLGSFQPGRRWEMILK